MNPKRWAQVEELFHRAAEHEADQRCSFLDEACKGDLEVRLEVEALLTSDENAVGCLQSVVQVALDTFAFPLTGDTIAHFLILDGLDGGGMGVVYRARDIRLGRPVAVKFLPEDSTRDPQARNRFEREARAASALEHPNICPIYEFGEHEGQPFLVMPLLDGHTLRELISSRNEKNKSLDLGEVLDFASQILAGLDAAHRRGLIHRDIKPANIFVTRDGHIKILDFGLAKLAGTEEQERSVDISPVRKSDLPLLDLSLSRTGIAIGTPGYMSPEQVRGQSLDARTDLYSFGLVLYEMATGQRTVPEGMDGAIQNTIRDRWLTRSQELSPQLSEKLAAILSKALQPDIEKRYQSAAELCADLEKFKEHAGPAGYRSRLVEISVVLVILVGVGIVYFASRHSPVSTPVPSEFKLRQLTSNSAENHLLNGAISPNGKFLAYTDLKGLHLKRLDTGETRPVTLPGQTVEAYNNDPAWFPDSLSFVVNTVPRSSGFKGHTPSDATIWRIFVTGTKPRKLRENAFAWGVSPDGSQIAFGTRDGRFGPREVWLMGADGEKSHMLYATDQEHTIGPFSWSPDGQHLGFIKGGDDGDVGFSMDLRGNSPVANASKSELDAVPGILLLPDHEAIYSLFEAGVESTCNFWMAAIDPQTLKPVESMRRLTNWTGFCMNPTSATSDGKNIAFLKWTNSRTIYVADLNAAQNQIVRSAHFTLDETGTTPVDWSPDGETLVFSSTRNGNSALFRQGLNDDTPELIITAPSAFSDPLLSAEGKWILWQIEDRSLPRRLMRVPVKGGDPEQIAQVGPEAHLSCAHTPSAACILAERTADRRQVVLSFFDPLKGRGSEITRLDVSADDAWDGSISSDGTRFAFIGGPSRPIDVILLSDHSMSTVVTAGLNSKRSLRWNERASGFYVTNGVKGGSDLFYVDLHGLASKLWHNDGEFAPIAVASPGGRRLAIQGSTLNQNMWLLENLESNRIAR